MAVISNTNSLRLGLSDDFAEIYRNRFVDYQSESEPFLRRITTTLRRYEASVKESIPIVKYWPYGVARQRQVFRDRLMTIFHQNYELSLSWLKWDEDDDTLKDLSPHVQQMVRRFEQLKDIFVQEYLEATASTLPSLQNAYDGAALLSTTDGDANSRYAVTGGNILTGNGTGSSASIIQDLFRARTRFLQFKDTTRTQPFFSDEECSFTNMTVVIPTQLTQVFTEAQEQKLGAVNPAIVTAADNVVYKKFNLWINQRLSTASNDWYVMINHPYLKPFAYVERETLQQVMEDQLNSSVARDKGVHSMLAYVRCGFAPFAPMSIIKVNN